MQAAVIRLDQYRMNGDKLALAAANIVPDVVETALLAAADAVSALSSEQAPHHGASGAPDEPPCAAGGPSCVEPAMASDEALARFLYDLAVGDYGVAHAERAAVLLSALLYEDGFGADPALGLAVCAVRLGCVKEALVFARESLARGGKHPRAFCIVGLCELELGDRSAAQQHLAVACRLARSKPEFREDMRLAQRLLLVLNFGLRKRNVRWIARKKDG